ISAPLPVSYGNTVAVSVVVNSDGSSGGTSPSSSLLKAVKFALPQSTLEPHRSVKPCVVLAPQITELPHSTDELFTKTFAPQITELPHSTELFQQTGTP